MSSLRAQPSSAGLGALLQFSRAGGVRADSPINPNRASTRWGGGLNIRRLVGVIERLQKRPHTVRELAEAENFHRETARHLVKTLLEMKVVEFMGYASRGSSGSVPATYGWKRGGH